ncbi:MAG: AbrB/MazE/SpoVT family DNA-binding domain-containing protein [Salinisphaera sp.]|nr:AbrB/MazE/SpoVT family DNA-binding domain-containing protein [Salinisphaera sp.]
MAKVTSKLQVTVPKQLAQRYGIQPGDEIQWQPAGDAVRVVPVKALAARADTALRRKWFDLATERQREREAINPRVQPAQDRG